MDVVGEAGGGEAEAGEGDHIEGDMPLLNPVNNLGPEDLAAHLVYGSFPASVRRPYCFRKEVLEPPTLYNQARKAILARYLPKNGNVDDSEDYPIARKRSIIQLQKYFDVLPFIIKEDLLNILYHCQNLTYVHSLRTQLDQEMYFNDLCCTHPDECSGEHSVHYAIKRPEYLALWHTLQGSSTSTLNLLPFKESYKKSYTISVNKSFKFTYQFIENLLSTTPSMINNVSHLLFVGIPNSQPMIWDSILRSMTKLTKIELHFWSGEKLFKIIKDECVDIQELILLRERDYASHQSKDLPLLPPLISKFKSSLRVFILENRENFNRLMAQELQKALSTCTNLECLKVEAEESPYLYWTNIRRSVKTKVLIMNLRKSYHYRTIMRNVNRCFPSDVKIELFYDTYVDVENHKYSFYSQGPFLDGGDHTVTSSTKNFEARELESSFYPVMSEFGAKVRKLSLETDIRIQYFQYMFPNIESLEMLSRASRKLPVDPRFVESRWTRIRSFTLDVNPLFNCFAMDNLLVFTFGDLFTYADSIVNLKIMGGLSGLKLSETRLLDKLRNCISNIAHLETVEILSPYCLSRGGLTWRTAEFFLLNCPRLKMLRDVASWGGDEANWENIVRLAANKHNMQVCWAEKASLFSTYTLDYDAEGWRQVDTGHKFELYHNLNDDV